MLLVLRMFQGAGQRWTLSLRGWCWVKKKLVDGDSKGSARRCKQRRGENRDGENRGKMGKLGHPPIKFCRQNRWLSDPVFGTAFLCVQIVAALRSGQVLFGMMSLSVKTDKAAAITAQQIGHLKKLVHLLPLLGSLHEVGTDRDPAGNRELHFDQYVIWVLLYLFNPLITSIRMLPQASDIEQAMRGATGGQAFLSWFVQRIGAGVRAGQAQGSHSSTGRRVEAAAIRSAFERTPQARARRSSDGTCLNALTTVAAAMAASVHG